MATVTEISEADILREVVDSAGSAMTPDAARSLLNLEFSSRDRERMRKLLDRNNKGTITEAELALLDRYRRVGMLIDLLQAEARLVLKQSAVD
jgi:hypothetical protein